MLCACSGVYAESKVLPPVVDYSTNLNRSAASTATPSANAMYDVLGRLEQLQAEVQQLRGLVEEQSQTILDLKKRQSNIYSDLDQRLQELTGGDVKTGTSPLIDTSSSTNDLATGLSQGIVDYPVSVKNGEKPSDAKTNTAVTNQKELYQSAYETLRNGHNTRAIFAFKALLKEFPDGEYADNAQYWLAEAYKVNQDSNSAKAAFTKLVTQYPESPKVPDGLLKLGYIEYEQKNMAKARDYLTQVSVNHPGTTAAHLAAKKLRQMGAMQP